MCTNDAGVYLTLRGTVLANNSFVDINSIGSNNSSALLCHTNETDCCRSTDTMLPNPSIVANWYYDNGTAVRNIGDIPDNDSSDVVFVSSRGQSVINLLLSQHADKNTTERGHFYCLISDADGTNHTLHVNICKLMKCHLYNVISFINTITKYLKLMYSGHWRCCHLTISPNHDTLRGNIKAELLGECISCHSHITRHA